MKKFECGTLLPGCNWSTSSDKEAEVVQHAVDHMRTTHNESVIRPSMVEAIKQRVRETA